MKREKGEMKMRLTAALMSMALTLPLLTHAADPKAHADFVDASGQSLGQATLQGGPNGTLITLDLKGLPAGPKAIHIHAVGHCDDGGEGFKHSGAHLNPDNSKHGLLNPEGPDAGDLPNFFVHADGTAKAQFFTPKARLDKGTAAHILDEDGAALVIHAGPDDHTSQPIGGAGDRIACAVIKAG
jgi:Cu-Zn family superoxide dismutase